MSKLIPALICALALTAARSSWADGPELAFQQFTLSNGLTVILHEDHSIPVAAVNILYKVGSKNEELGKTGFAHLFEHLMFEGSAHVPNGQFDRRIVGCGGYNNADTTQDRTDYYEVFPSECLEDILRLDADRMGFLDVSEDSLNKQRGIVENEKRMRVDNEPYGQAFEALADTVWDKGHPYKWEPLGSMDELKKASLLDVRRFHSVYYNPNNAILVISGDIDSQTVMPMVRKWFGALSEGPTPPRVNVPQTEPLTARRERTIEDDKVQLPRIYIAYRIPANGPEARAMEVLASILGGGRTSRLVQSLQYEQRFVLSIDAEVYGLRENDLFLITAAPCPGVSPARIEAAVNAELARVMREGIAAGEMARVKAQLKTSRLNALQSMGEIAAALAEGQAFEGNPAAVDARLVEIERMTPDTPRSAARKYLNPYNAAVVTVIPKEGERP